VHIVSVKEKMPVIQKCRQQNSNIASDIEKFPQARCQQNEKMPVKYTYASNNERMPVKRWNASENIGISAKI
jgi:hypothetical protein